MVRRLGIGGMGVVYQAFDKEYNAEVALKVMRFAGDGEYVQRFKNEFRYLQGVRHPNLVRYLELVQEEGLWFFTMELVRGVDFLEWVRPGLVEGSLEKFASADTVILAEGEVSHQKNQRLPRPF